jgi:phosphoribosyl-ATP pyrophosphohydrolase
MPDVLHWLIAHENGVYARMPLCWATPEQIVDEAAILSRPVLSRRNAPPRDPCQRCLDAAHTHLGAPRFGDFMQQQIEAFHRKFGHVIGTTPAISRPELRVKLIREEAKETCDAIEAGDLPAAVDGICDLVYVAIGAAVEFGVDIRPLFAEVHAANMRKVGGTTREDGKTLKPPGWVGPDIVGELLKQGYKVPE